MNWLELNKICIPTGHWEGYYNKQYFNSGANREYTVENADVFLTSVADGDYFSRHISAGLVHREWMDKNWEQMWYSLYMLPWRYGSICGFMVMSDRSGTLLHWHNWDFHSHTATVMIKCTFKYKLKKDGLRRFWFCKHTKNLQLLLQIPYCHLILQLKTMSKFLSDWFVMYICNI